MEQRRDRLRHSLTQQLSAVPPIESDRAQLMLLVGRKGSGKSVVARSLFAHFPGDKVCVDVTGDADPGPAAMPLRTPLPPRMPPPDSEGRPQTWHVRLDPDDPAYKDQLDQAAALALYPQTRPGLVWFDEWAEVAENGRLNPNAHRLLMQSRHHQASAMLCTPRPQDIGKLSRTNVDYVFVFDLIDPDDIDVIAGAIGLTGGELREELAENRARGKATSPPTPHWYLRYDVRNDQLIRCPPIPYTDGAHDKPA